MGVVLAAIHKEKEQTMPTSDRIKWAARVLRFGLVLGALLTLRGTAHSGTARAQESPPNCEQRYAQGVENWMAHCYTSSPATVCAATDGVSIETLSGQRVNGAGRTARLSSVAALELSAEGGAWPLARVHLYDVTRQEAPTLLVMGPAALHFDEATGAYWKGTSFALETASTPLCDALPYPAVLIQSPQNMITLLRINGTELAVNGTALVSARSSGALQITSLYKETILGQSGAVVFAGYTVSALGEYAGEVVPYEAGRVAHLPMDVLPRIEIVPLPGNAVPTQETTLYSQPQAAYYTNTTAPVGVPVNVYGQDVGGEWVLVRTYEGEIGWLPAYGLEMHVPVALPVYAETLTLPRRPFGAVQGYVKTSGETNNLRAGPSVKAAVVATVPLWTDLALYGRSADGQWLLVETLEGVRGWVSVDVISSSTPYNLDELPYGPE